VGRRTVRISALVVVVLALTATATAAPASPPGATRTLSAVDMLESSVLAQLNVVRRKHGLQPLRLSRPLSAAAELHSAAMGRHGFFAHDSRDGSAFWERVRRFYGPSGYRTWSVGENLLWSSAGDLDAAEAVRLWMNSAGHRKNILTPRWREIGVAAVGVKSAPGVFGGRDVVIITTDFGIRA
jgi:uncharacterized protein YkwD